jgi:hypothetical protein
MKKAILFLFVALMVFAAGCAKNPGSDTTTANSNTAIFQAPEPVNQSDGSDITTTTAPNGFKNEVRSFREGTLIQISRATWPDGRQAATVRFRDGRAVDLTDPADIEQAMTASSETIVASAVKTGGLPNTPATTASSNKTPGEKAGTKGKK